MAENTGKTLSLRWLQQRYMEACIGRREPNILVIGVAARLAYFELLTGRKDEFYARAKYMAAKVVACNTIGEWDVVFGFKSTLEGDAPGWPAAFPIGCKVEYSKPGTGLTGQKGEVVAHSSCSNSTRPIVVQFNTSITGLERRASYSPKNLRRVP